MDEGAFKVQINDFEGPLDLLLQLIERRKLCVNDVSLSEITDNYCDHVRSLEQYSFAKVSDFIIVAATLMHIKSVSLLPTIQLTKEESSDVEDLQGRLMKLQEMRNLGDHIRGQYLVTRIFPRGEIKRQPFPSFSPSPTLNTATIYNSLRSMLAQMPVVEKKPEVTIKKIVHLEEVIENMVKKIQKSITMSFREFSGNSTERVNIIVNFLAMLELVKRGIVHAKQENNFEEIRMENNVCAVPRYGV